LSEQLTARELRPILREAELAVARIRRSSAAQEIIALFDLLDQLATALPRLRQAGAQLEPELVRFETIGAILRDKAHHVVRGMRQSGGLAATRQQVAPPENHWWWYLDQHVARARAQQRTRRVRGILAATAVIAILAVLYVLFLRPDKTTRQRYDYQFGAEAQMQQGNYDQALVLYHQALELAPEDAELNLAAGILYEALQQPENAAKQYAKAESLYETRAAFITARAQQYLRLGWYEQAAREAQAATKLDDRYALAQCTLGSAYQLLGENNNAIAALWVCADLASEQGQDELYVHAKTLLANLMQQPS
jgi:tetratricopeptide (TPR) repeat protein